jgi:hypothetical protein|nr:MAG TPA: hypothetical protein [Caudoviricetes sp.]
MQKVITKSGFECLIDKKQMDDMELVDKIAEADAGNPLAVSAVIEKVLGKEQKAKLYNHLRNEDGRVPIEKVGEEIVEIITSLGSEGKN